MPKGAIYLFPRLDPAHFDVADDVKLVLDILEQEKVLLVQGSAFNITDTHHLRIVFLPRLDELENALQKLANVLDQYRI